MNRLMILALAASLLPCASFAQTPMLTVAAPLKANSGDQNIKLSSARTPFKRGAVIKLCPVTEVTPASSYVAKAATCPTPVVAPPVVVPPVVTPLASTSEALQRGEAFLQSDTMTVGLNPFGGTGTLYAERRASAPTQRLACIASAFTARAITTRSSKAARSRGSLSSSMASDTRTPS